jgi:hypothetical protein
VKIVCGLDAPVTANEKKIRGFASLCGFGYRAQQVVLTARGSAVMSYELISQSRIYFVGNESRSTPADKQDTRKIAAPHRTNQT